jgi:pimeloyl-ACP methyl ester carboxylesterase
MGVSFLFSFLLMAGTARADLAEKFQEELTHDPNTTPLAAQVLYAVQARPIVMIAGILNEEIPGYWKDNMKTLRKDFKQKEFARMMPNSQNKVEKNAPLVARFIYKAWKKFGQKPVIVLAHSKGANETLLALLGHPELLREGIVDRVVFIQGALKGSHIADLLLDNDAGDYWAAQPWHWLFHHWYGLWSMTTRDAYPTLETALGAADPADVALLNEKLYYVRAEQLDEKKCSWELQLMHEFVRVKYGESDGVMMPGDELIDGLGTDLGIVTGDHFDLTERGLSTATPPSYRRAFTRALFRELFE